MLQPLCHVTTVSQRSGQFSDAPSFQFNRVTVTGENTAYVRTLGNSGWRTELAHQHRVTVTGENTAYFRTLGNSDWRTEHDFKALLIVAVSDWEVDLVTVTGGNRNTACVQILDNLRSQDLPEIHGDWRLCHGL